MTTVTLIESGARETNPAPADAPAPAPADAPEDFAVLCDQAYRAQAQWEAALNALRDHARRQGVDSLYASFHSAASQGHRVSASAFITGYEPGHATSDDLAPAVEEAVRRALWHRDHGVERLGS